MDLAFAMPRRTQAETSSPTSLHATIADGRGAHVTEDSVEIVFVETRCVRRQQLAGTVAHAHILNRASACLGAPEALHRKLDLGAGSPLSVLIQTQIPAAQGVPPVVAGAFSASDLRHRALTTLDTGIRGCLDVVAPDWYAPGRSGSDERIGWVFDVGVSSKNVAIAEVHCRHRPPPCSCNRPRDRILRYLRRPLVDADNSPTVPHPNRLVVVLAVILHLELQAAIPVLVRTGAMADMVDVGHLRSVSHGEIALQSGGDLAAASAVASLLVIPAGMAHLSFITVEGVGVQVRRPGIPREDKTHVIDGHHRHHGHISLLVGVDIARHTDDNLVVNVPLSNRRQSDGARRQTEGINTGRVGLTADATSAHSGSGNAVAGGRIIHPAAHGVLHFLTRCARGIPVIRAGDGEGVQPRGPSRGGGPLDASIANRLRQETARHVMRGVGTALCSAALAGGHTLVTQRARTVLRGESERMAPDLVNAGSCACLQRSGQCLQLLAFVQDQRSRLKDRPVAMVVTVTLGATALALCAHNRGLTVTEAEVYSSSTATRVHGACTTKQALHLNERRCTK
mmetsp:Transcript_7426/g.15919  ORF Transcript_7426/g.15919 Transcript_7426/m.15919 type:complete len:568 (-) Transcript_7426:6301-8004(-)